MKANGLPVLDGIRSMTRIVTNLSITIVGPAKRDETPFFIAKILIFINIFVKKFIFLLYNYSYKIQKGYNFAHFKA